MSCCCSPLVSVRYETTLDKAAFVGHTKDMSRELRKAGYEKIMLDKLKKCVKLKLTYVRTYVLTYVTLVTTLVLRLTLVVLLLVVGLMALLVRPTLLMCRHIRSLLRRSTK